MPSVTVAELLDHTDLRLRLLVTGHPRSVSWAHSSDLPDPTPFLEPGQLLLTTATQFGATSSDGEIEAYVQRLTAVGVPALGIGTAVAWPQPPAALVAACRAQSLTLFEVPYATPFIAVVRWIADALAAQASARDAWSISAQRTVSLAALSVDRLPAVLTELARQLGGRVLLYDGHGQLAGAHGAAPPALDQNAIDDEARRLLRGNARAGSQLGRPGCTVALQTLGRRDGLRGVLATATAAAPDAAANAVIVGGVALVELALEDTGRFRAQQAAINQRLLELLLQGERAVVERVLRSSGQRLPEAPVRVLVSARDPDPDLDHRLTQSARRDWVEIFSAPYERGRGPQSGLGRHHRQVVVVSEPWWQTAARLYHTQGVAVGVSARCEYQGLAAAVAAAASALEHTSADQLLVTADDQQLLGLLPRGEVTELARSRLRPVLEAPDADELVRSGTAWLRHNARYEPAARELGVHRHTLKAQVRRLGRLLQLDLGSFAGKAELWALLQAH